MDEDEKAKHMKKILIADASKASLVMTSEVFKDHFPGVHVLVAKTSAEALEIAKKEESIDAFVVDFDLPDKDGAYTAARIKKMYSIPVLITAFDRDDVQEAIQHHCSAYDDCLSWLAKPVNSELVVSIAHRFIEGSYRTQRRVDCLIPSIVEVVAELKNSRKPTTNKATGKTPTATAKATKADPSLTEKICIPVMVEDCSVGGFKFRIQAKVLKKHPELKVPVNNKLNIKKTLSCFLPSFESIQTGEENVGYWLWGEDPTGKAKGKAKGKSSGTRSISSRKTTLSALMRSTKSNPADKEHDGQAIKGKIIWTTQDDDGDFIIGVRSDNLILSKKLFEAVLIGESRRNARKDQSAGGSGSVAQPARETSISTFRYPTN